MGKSSTFASDSEQRFVLEAFLLHNHRFYFLENKL